MASRALSEVSLSAILPNVWPGPETHTDTKMQSDAGNGSVKEAHERAIVPMKSRKSSVDVNESAALMSRVADYGERAGEW